MAEQKIVYYIERKTNTKKKEAIYGESFLTFLYANHFFNKALAYLIAHIPLISHLYGFWQKTPFSKKKVLPFIERYQIDPSEFEKNPNDFTSFNDFFCRTLKKGARPIPSLPDKVIAPADGRYLVVPKISASEGFYVKGHAFTLNKLLRDPVLAKEYQEGAMVIARLCPTDYHRFHFPLSGTPSKAHLINGALWSVNPLAICQNIHFFSENKRVITEVSSKQCGPYLYIEVGATNVGSIHQTYRPGITVEKGDEKGFFSFGGSSVILLFKPNTILFDSDIIKNSSQYTETLILMGESLGVTRL